MLLERVVYATRSSSPFRYSAYHALRIRFICIRHFLNITRLPGGVRSELVISLSFFTPVFNQLAKSAPILKNPAIRIIVASSDVMYGIGRVFEAYGSETRDMIHVVRTLPEAYRLVGTSIPVFEPSQVPELSKQEIQSGRAATSCLPPA